MVIDLCGVRHGAMFLSDRCRPAREPTIVSVLAGPRAHLVRHLAGIRNPDVRFPLIRRVHKKRPERHRWRSFSFQELRGRFVTPARRERPTKMATLSRDIFTAWCCSPNVPGKTRLTSRDS